MTHTDPVPENQDPQIIAFYLEGHTLKETGAEFGINFQRVRHLLIRAGVERRPRGGRPSNPSRDAGIVAFYLAPHNLRETGAMFGISHERVRQIILRAGAEVHAPHFAIARRAASMAVRGAAR